MGQINNSVPASRQIIAGTGMSGGGSLGSNVTLNIADPVDDPTGDIIINNITMTIDRQGRITKTAGKKGNVPKVADFPTLAHLTASGTDLVPSNGDSGLYLQDQAPTVADNWRIKTQPTQADAASWEAVAHVQGGMPSANYFMFGMALFENDATGRCVIFGPCQNAGQFLHCRRGSKAGFATDVFQRNFITINGPVWLRVRWNLPDLKYYFDFGLDGVNWINVGSILKATAFAVRADNIGLGFWTNNGSAAYIQMGLCDYWKNS